MWEIKHREQRLIDKTMILRYLGEEYSAWFDLHQGRIYYIVLQGICDNIE